MTFKTAIAAAAAFVLITGCAKAEGVFTPPAEVVEAVTPAPAIYQTGGYLTGSVGIGIADVSSAAISFADESLTYGVGAGFDIVTGSLMIGVRADADWNDSADPAYQIGARAGVLLSPHTLVYATGGWAIADLGTDIDGYFVGAGTEFLINRNLFFGAEYTASLYGAEKGVDVTGHGVRGRLGWRF